MDMTYIIFLLSSSTQQQRIQAQRCTTVMEVLRDIMPIWMLCSPSDEWTIYLNNTLNRGVAVRLEPVSFHLLAINIYGHSYLTKPRTIYIDLEPPVY